MTSKNMLSVALRIGSILIIVNILEKVPLHTIDFGPNSNFNLYNFTATTILPNLILLFVATTMWFKPYLFLGHIAKDDISNSENLDIQKFGSILIAIVGLYIFVFSTVDLIYQISAIKLTKAILGVYYKHTPETIAVMIATGIEMTLGLLLIYARNPITGLIQRFKKETQRDL